MHERQRSEPKFYRAFGCLWQSEMAMPPFHAAIAPGRTADITVTFCDDAPVERAFPHAPRRMGSDREGLRYLAEHAIVDSFGLNRLEVRARDGWTGVLPAPLFSTVAGAMLAWRGALPMHGSAVEIDGEAVLVCGKAGAGKSTLASALIAAGARLISDDLSVLHAVEGSKVPVLYAGRRTVRLFPAVAGFFQNALGTVNEASMDLHSGVPKAAVAPPHVEPTEAILLRTVLLLGSQERPQSPAEKEAAFAAQFFRPARFSRVPGQVLREATLRAASGAVQFRAMPPVRVHDMEGLQDAARTAMALLRQA